MSRAESERKLQELAVSAWDGEIRWPDISAWSENFDGRHLGDSDIEQEHALFALTKFIYFGRRLVRELLRSLYRDRFEAPLIQRIRRNHRNTRDAALLRKVYQSELATTRFAGLGNPAESGAHLLYFFRQVNYLQKDLFADLRSLFAVAKDPTTGEFLYGIRDSGIRRVVLFDDLVGSATQVSQYLLTELRRIRRGNPQLEISFMALFATTEGLSRLNEPGLFDGRATCMFELDDSYKSHDAGSRYFVATPSWFDVAKFRGMAAHYGGHLRPGMALGYKGGQLMLGFSHNTPDNTLPIFWDEGARAPWAPVFPRFDKKY